jgi:hypothetical protein
MGVRGFSGGCVVYSDVKGCESTIRVWHGATEGHP